MAAKRIITIFGATGGQGGSVAKIFLEDAKLKQSWSVRAVTRDVTKESSKKLQNQGAEVVSADMNDKSTLVSAMTGAAAVFAVTNYWEKMDSDLEIKQGKDLVDAAKETGVQHFVWSSLFDITKLSKGALPNVHHFDTKAKVEEYARQVGSGKFVKAIVLKGPEVFGKRVLAASEYKTGDEIVATFKKVFPEAGKTATFMQLPQDVYKKALTGRGMPEFAAQELLENMLLLDQFGYYGGAKLDESHAILEDKLTSWEEFLKKSPAVKDLQ
ncbi:NmrA-domain-containing protein [Thozetella sp. PMI_491]|nr:NmrA-domain-containing protein [Thozetella sp. PMI_491]